MMVNDIDTKLVSKESRGLEKLVDIAKDYSDDFITLSAAHVEDATHGELLNINLNYTNTTIKIFVVIKS